MLPFDLLSKSNSLCADLKSSKEIARSLRDKLHISESEMGSAKLSISELKTDLNLKQEKLDALQEEKISAEFQIREAEGRVLENAALLQDLEHLRQQELVKVSEMTSRSEILTLQLQKSREKIIEEERNIADLSCAKNDLLLKVELLESDIAKSSTRYGELESKYKQLENSYRQQEVEIPDPEVLLIN
jgi:chromosome segregation ATPase